MLPYILPVDLPYISAAFLVGYLLGAIPFGLIVAQALGLGDPRKIGSGNIGATNMVRAGGAKAGALTLLLDAAKGVLAVWLASYYGPLTAAFAALGAMVGHVWPVWLWFRGGKGVATYIGALLGLAWPLGAAFCGAWLVVALIGWRSSLAALVAALVPPIMAYATDRIGLIWVTALMTLLLYYRHGANIGRLLRGEEPKISFGGSK